MAIRTSVARHYAIRMTVIGALCVIFGAWGAFDLFVKIPREQSRAERFEELGRRMGELENVGAESLTESEKLEYEQISRELESFEGKTPEAPSKFDHVVQIMAMSCILAAPYFFWLIVSARRRVYALEDDGTLVLPEGRWAADDIKDIDMSRWMAKSVATVVHQDGSRVKIDDYVHHNAHLIVGHIASKLHPGQWDEQARRPKPASETDVGSGAEDGEDGGDAGGTSA